MRSRMAGSWRIRERWLAVFCVGGVGLAAWVPASPAAAQMTIDTVTVTSGPAYAAGTFTDYFVDPEVTGTGIAAIEFSTQSGLTADLVQDADGTWECDEEIPSGPCEDFASLAQINALGDLTFSFEGSLGEMDTVVVPSADYAPGAGQAGFPVITSPSPGETEVSLDPTFSWNLAPSWVGVVLAAVEVSATGETVDEALLTALDVSWMPGGLPPETTQDFRLSFFDVFFFEDSRTSTGARSYLFSSGFEAFNFVSFATAAVPVPIGGWVGALLPLGIAFAGALALKRRRAA